MNSTKHIFYLIIASFCLASISEAQKSECSKAFVKDKEVIETTLKWGDTNIKWDDSTYVFKPFTQTISWNKPNFFADALIEANSMPLSMEETVSRILSGEDLKFTDLNVISKNFNAIHNGFNSLASKDSTSPKATIYAAIKGLYEPGMLETLVRSHGNKTKYETATVEELNKLLNLGVSGRDILFTHTDKDALEVSAAYKAGVRFFVTDSIEDLQLIAKHAPKSRIIVRVRVSNTNAHEDFNKRFGVTYEKAEELINIAKKQRLSPVGVSYHVGTQTTDPKIWDKNLKQAVEFFYEMQKKGYDLSILDVGGGLPMRVDNSVPKPAEFGEHIMSKINQYQLTAAKKFKSKYSDIIKEVVLEPGRGLGASSAFTMGRVINVKRNQHDNGKFDITLSTGSLSAGLILDTNGIFYYRPKVNGKDLQDVLTAKNLYDAKSIYNFLQKNKLELVPLKAQDADATLYGKACAAFDCVREKTKVPSAIQPGDIVIVTGTGSYTGNTTSQICSRPSPTNLIYDGKTKQFKRIFTPCR